MTLTTQTTYTVTCDGTLATACDASHPDRPHTCPASLTTPTTAALRDALAAGRWAITTLGGAVDSTTARHYCPAHRRQATHDRPAPRCDGSCGDPEPHALHTEPLGL
jgi:hypothetical protein